MAITIASPGFKDHGRSVTLTFLLMGNFLSPFFTLSEKHT